MGLAKRTGDERSAERRRTIIEGKCSIGSAMLQTIIVSDLSPEGCSIDGISLGVGRDEAILLWIGEHGPVPGTLRWAKSGFHGVQFSRPLHAQTVAAFITGDDPSIDSL